MSKIDDAFDQVRSLAEKFAAVLEVADSVKELGSIEQAITERKAARDAAIAAHDTAEADLEKALAALEQAREQQAHEAANHKAALTADADKSYATAIQLISDAKEQAQSLLAEAREEVDRVWSDSDKVMSSRRVDLDDCNAKIAEAQTKIDELRAEREAVEASINALKAAAKAVLA